MVRQAIVAAGGHVYVSRPKTKRSVRRVALDSETILVLEEYAGTKASDPDAWVFSSACGGYLQPTSISKMFHRLVTQSGVRPIRLHDLRHTSATLALEAGIHPKIVSERLGHSTVSLTLDIYSHAIPHLQEEAADQLGRLIMAQPSGI
jgi:integrase